MEVHLHSLLGRLLHLVVDIHHIVLVELLEGHLRGLGGLLSDIECLTVVAEVQVRVLPVF